MPSFVLVFRSSAALSADQLARRNSAAREWALARQHDGSLRFPAPLEDAGAMVGSAGTEPTTDVAAILVIDAPDLAQAIALAKTHPGLPFGTKIEVRPVKATGPR